MTQRELRRRLSEHPIAESSLPSPEAVRQQLQAILASRPFVTATRARRFLTHIVEETLAGQVDGIKELVLGVEVFDRPADFDPKVDTIVRVEALKLRKRLEEYYAAEGAKSALRIEVPRGSYVPRFQLRALQAAPEVAGTAITPRRRRYGIGAIRKALGEQAGDQRYVLTVPGRNYSFIAEVNEDRPPEPAPVHARVSFSMARLSVSVVLIAALAAGVIWIGASRSSPQPRLVPLTGSNNEGSVFAFSPSGDRVAYAWYPPQDQMASGGIYVKVIGAGDPLPLAVGMGQHGPAWSPDGQYIAYYRRPPGVYLIPALGGAERKLASLSIIPEQVPRMGWSPDGKHLAIPDGDPDTGFSSIFELTVDTGERRKLTSGRNSWGDSSPAYSPDGKSLGFMRRRTSDSSAVFMIPAAGGEPRQVTRFEQSADSFDWTPNGREIVYSAMKDGNDALWRVPVSGGPQRRIVDAGFDTFGPVVAGSGNRLAFWQFHDTVDLWRLDFDRPSQPRKLAPNLKRQTSPQYSPDGSKLAFRSNRLNGDEVWISDNEGHNLRALTSMETLHTFAGSPHWSPDGLEIAFASSPGANADIYVVNSQGGSPRRITSDPAEDVHPSFSRDGRYIYFSSNRSGSFQIWKVGRTGGDAVQVTRQGGVAGLESMDGKYLYYLNYQHANLWRVPAAGGVEEMVFEGASVWKRQPWRWHWGWWTIGAGGIVYVDWDLSGPQTVWEIKLFDPETRAISTLTRFLRPPAFLNPCLTVSPDGRSVVYAQMADSTKTIMLLENFR